MKRKITSVLIILLIVGANAAPFINSDSCDMACCQGESMSCMMEQMEPCEISVNVCDTPMIIPLVVAPVNSIELKKFENIEMVYNIKSIDVIVENNLSFPIKWIKPPDPPAAFTTPLLI